MSTIPFAFTPKLLLQFPPKSVNGAIQFKHSVAGSLMRHGHTPSQAAGLAPIYEAAYIYARNNWPQIVASYGHVNSLKTAWDAYESGSKFTKASVLLDNAQSMDASAQIIKGFSNARMVAGAGILSGLVSVMELVAEKNNIPLNMCALSIATVSLDLVGVASGGLTVEFGIGGVLALMNIVALTSDSYELAASCRLIKS